MPIHAACPSCGVKLEVPDSLVGKQVRCASCSTVFVATAESSPPREPPAEPEHREAQDPWEGDDDYDYDDRRRIRRDLLPHRGGMILTLGIISAVTSALGFCCGCLSVIGLPLGITAWMLGQADLKRIANGEMDPDGRGMTQAGYICGIVGCVGAILALICTGLWFAFNMSAAFMQNGKGPF